MNPESVAVRIQAQGGEAVELLRPGRRFVEPGSGWLKTKTDLAGGKTLAVYIEPARPLKPATTYAVHVSAESGRRRRATRGRGNLELHHRSRSVHPGA